MPLAPTTRLANVNDRAAVQACVDAAYARYVPRIGKKPAPMVADYDALIRQGLVQVLERDGGCAAILVGFPEDDHWFIENIAVDPRHQGHGLGKALIDVAIAEARRLGLGALLLYTNEAMTEALGFYQRLGFVEVDRRLEDGFRRVYMRLALEGE